MIDFSNITAIALGVEDVLQIQDSLGTVLWQKVIYYNVSISAGSNGTVSVNGVSGDYSQSVPAGTVLTIEGTGTTGYDFDTWSDGNTDNPRTITVTGDLTLTASFAQAVTANYFYVEDISGNGSTVSIQKGGNTAPTIQPYFSTDGTNWYSVGTTSSSTPLTYNVPANGKLYIKCTADRWGQNVWDVNQNKTNRISVSDNYNIGGNIMSLLYGDNFENATFGASNETAFSFIFYGETHLLSAASLVLPTNTNQYVYIGMFYGCTNLTAVPVLPATTVANIAYQSMFQGCTSLTTAPALPATTIGIASYQSMFEGCTALTTPPVLPTTTITERQGYQTMFKGCTSLNVMYVYADTITGQNATSNWLQNVAATGDFYNLGSYAYTIDSPSGVPVGWTLHHSLPVPCNVSISSNGNGSVSVNGVSGDYSDTVMSGTQLTLVATPDSGYYLTSWSDGDTNTSRTITVTADLTLTASFAQVVNYNVSISAGSNGSVSVNGVSGNYSASVAAGTTLNLVATADSGYMFDEWSDGDTNASRTITVTGNLTLTASFIVEYQPNDELWYRTSNNQPISLTNMSFGNVSVVSNTYTNGKGVVKFSGNLTSISNSAINNPNTNLTHIWFPDSLTTVNRHSFDNCPIENLDLNNITTVGEEAFDFHHTAHIHIPATCTSLTMNPFRSSYTTSITVDPNNPVFTDGSAHNGSNCVYSGTTLVVGCVNTVIPDNCTVIGEFGLCDIAPLTTVDFPSTIRQLKNFAVGIDSTVTFNPSLSVVYARSTPTFGTGVFIDQKTNGTLYYINGVNYSTWLNKLPSGWTAVLLCNTTISAGNNGTVSVNGVSGDYHQSELPSGTQLTLVATPAAGYQFDSWSDGDNNATRTVTITADTTLTASFAVITQPNDELWYRTSNNQPISLTNMSFGNVSVVSNTYSDGKGVVKFSGALTSMSNSTTNSPSQYLTHIWFPDSLINVGQHSFISCPIENLDLNNITTVGVGAFLGHHTEHIHIPATCTSIGYRSFRSPYTTSITVDANNPNYNDGSAHNGSNCIYQGTTLQTGCKNTVIPDNCTTIGGWALSECGMVSMNIPASVQTVGESSMDNNTNLTTLYVHSTPTFGYAPFYGTKTNGTLYYTSNVNYQNWLNRLPSGWTAVLLCNTTISAGNNGTVSVNGVSGDYHQPELVSGTQLTLVATPDSGYVFDSWSDGDNNATRTVTITADTTLTASFVQQIPSYSVSISAGNNGTVRVNGTSGNYSQNVMSGTQMTLEAIPDAGYQFDSWSDGDTNATRTLTVSGAVTLTASFIQQVGEPFYIEDASGNGNTLSIVKVETDAPTIEVFKSTDGTNWSSMGTTSTTAITASIPANSKLYLKATANQWGLTTMDEYNKIDCDQNFNVGGNIMSLLAGDNYAGATLDTNYESQFRNLFFHSTHLIDASNLVLPNNVTRNCYRYMFFYCTSLTTPPALPATTLEFECYYQMFDGCSSLTTAPTLNATTLAIKCCMRMFGGCTSLTTAPALNATTLANKCYQSMFYGCRSLTQAPALPATTLANYCYEKMFYNCTGLTTTPELPATTLANFCYSDMFNGCTSLTTTPELPATTLVDDCYHCMFYGCTSLTETPQLPATTLEYECYNGMFENCTSLNKVVVYADDRSASKCTLDWLYNVAATGNFYALGSANWTIDSPSGVPVGWTLHTSTPVPCNVTITSNGNNGSVSVNGVSGNYSATVMSGSTLTIQAIPDTDCTFLQWSDGNTSLSRTIIIENDLTLTANFAVEYKLTGRYYSPTTTTSVKILNNTSDIIKMEIDGQRVSAQSYKTLGVKNGYKNVVFYLNSGTVDISKLFQGCEYMTELTIGKMIDSVAKTFISSINTFVYLNKVYVDSNNATYDQRGYGCVETATNTLVLGGGETTIDSTVTKIGDYAMAYVAYKSHPSNTRLSSPTWSLPESVSRLGDRAFYDTPNCYRLYVYRTPMPTLGTRSLDYFGGGSSTLHFRAGYIISSAWKDALVDSRAVGDKWTLCADL